MWYSLFENLDCFFVGLRRRLLAHLLGQVHSQGTDLGLDLLHFQIDGPELLGLLPRLLGLGRRALLKQRRLADDGHLACIGGCRSWPRLGQGVVPLVNLDAVVEAALLVARRGEPVLAAWTPSRSRGFAEVGLVEAR